MTKQEFVDDVLNIVCKEGEEQPTEAVLMMGNALVGMGIALLQQSGLKCLDVVENIVAKWPQPKVVQESKVTPS